MPCGSIHSLVAGRHGRTAYEGLGAHGPISMRDAFADGRLKPYKAMNVPSGPARSGAHRDEMKKEPPGPHQRLQFSLASGGNAKA